MNSILLITVLLLAPVVLLAQEGESSNSELKTSTEPQGRARMSWSDTAEKSEPVKVRRVARGLSGGSAGANIRFKSEDFKEESEQIVEKSDSEQLSDR